MGLYDRHYMRDVDHERGTYRRGTFAGLRMLSVNTWIIIICVAVFVIDGFTPTVFLETDNVYPQSLQQVPSAIVTDMQRVQRIAVPQARLSGIWAPVVEKASGNDVGWREVVPMHVLTKYLHFSTALGFLKIEYWRFIGFQFLHANITHILFNMMGLFFFGPLVEQYLGSKRYLAFYLLCGIFGAIMYLILNLGGVIATQMAQHSIHIPGLLFTDPFTPLVGASAGIFGVLIAGAYLAPRAEVLLFFFFPMQLRTLAYLLVAAALISVLTGGGNAGGEAGHIGGAIAGFYFIRRPHHLHGFFDFLGRADPTSHHYRRPKGMSRNAPAEAVRRAEIDRILDKINQSGIHSLSDEEKRLLGEESRRA